MIHAVCPDCGWPIQIKFPPYDTEKCPRCECIVRITLTKLRPGKPGFADKTDLRGQLPVSDQK